MEKLPKDLGVKIVSQEQSFWLSMKLKFEEEIRVDKKSLMFNKEILKMVLSKIK